MKRGEDVINGIALAFHPFYQGHIGDLCQIWGGGLSNDTFASHGVNTCSILQEGLLGIPISSEEGKRR
jgi:hypothetical protein